MRFLCLCLTLALMACSKPAPNTLTVGTISGPETELVEVAQKVAANPERNFGIVICGSGMGAEVAANKVRGVRCGLGFEPDQVHAGRKDDNINVLALASDNVTEDVAYGLVEKFLETEFVETDRYVRRVEKISRYEKEVYEHHRRG